jgi:hypothetical protein
MRRPRAFLGGVAIGALVIVLTFGAASALDLDGGRVQVFDIPVDTPADLPPAIMWEGAVSLPSVAPTPSASELEAPLSAATPAATPTPTQASVEEPTPAPTATSAPTPTPEPTPAPTPTPEPVDEATPTPTPSPSEAPDPSG